MTPVVVLTGAFDCGKTTTLAWLREQHSVRSHGEAHLAALARLGERKLGHPSDRGLTSIEDPDHFCPMCRPTDFARLVLAEQTAIETLARPGDLLERGWVDPIEMLLRTAGEDAPRPVWSPVARYVAVLVFEVMPELQRPRWGKSAAVRIEEARAIQARLLRAYRDAGHEPIAIAPGSVEDRGAHVLEVLATHLAS